MLELVPENEETPAFAGVSGEALHGTRTRDPFLTMEVQTPRPVTSGHTGAPESASDESAEDPSEPPKRPQDAPTKGARSERPMATCTRCGAPLIPTCVWPKFEFYCLECGTHHTFFGPQPAAETPELRARYEALKAEWDEHAGRKLLIDGWYGDCERCSLRGEYHTAHATDEERAADTVARAWLAQRAGRTEARA